MTPPSPPSPDDDVPNERKRGRPKGGRTRQNFLLRLPPDLFDELRGWAGHEFRSLNSQIEFLLREAVKRRHGKDR